MSEQPAKMWSGRFREPLDPTFDHWQRSFGFDRQLLQEEVAASKAHALALKAAGILTERRAVCDRAGAWRDRIAWPLQ